MAGRLSRRKLAIHAAERLIAGDSAVVDELAALLIDERREREADLLVRDIEDQLAQRGEMVVVVEAARTIDSDTKRQIEQLFPGKNVSIREVIRPELIGGFRLMTPTQLLDISLAKKLTDLRAMKV